MIVKRFLAVLAAGIACVFAFAAPALATGDKPAPACPDWMLHSITGTTWGDAALGSTIIGPNNVVLVKPTGGGTELATDDAGIDLGAAADITVNYTLLDRSSTAAGAIRLFYYQAPDSNTLTTAPTAFAAATGTDLAGTLTVHALAGHVGTLGVVYDASNSAAGKVKFGQLKVGDVSVAFTGKPCEPPPSPSASASASESASASTSPSTSASASESASPSSTNSHSASASASASSSSPAGGTDATDSPEPDFVVPAGDSGPSGGALPTTGAKVAAFGLIGVAMVLGGIALFGFAWRRRRRFAAVEEL